MTTLLAPVAVPVLTATAIASIQALVLRRNEPNQSRSLRIELGAGRRVEFFGKNGRYEIKAGRIEDRTALAGLINYYLDWLTGGACPAAPQGLLQVRHEVEPVLP